MKRGADAMDAGDLARGDRNGNRGWKRPEHDHKRMRRADEARNRDGGSGAKGAEVRTLADETETDPHRLAQRQKQIDYGKNTIGYDRYCAQVPRHRRRPGRHPMTPDKTKKMGKKVFDGIVRKWRQALHKYDPPELVEAIKTASVEAVPSESIETAAEAGALSRGKAISSDVGEVVATDKSTSAAPEATEETVTPPALVPSIYDNFDEDNFDEDSDDDLL